MESRIKQVMSQVLGVDASRIDDQTSPHTLKEWDSLQHVTLVLALQEEFGLEFSHDEVLAMMSFTGIRDTLKTRAK
ncbi:MAG: acyl carrier protein [Candidatus Omnitrophica bacterium]|nr:acyl carrier protein [Candidatus Omnitrophota bacterium]